MPDNIVKIEIDGVDFSAFKSGSVNKRLDALCGSFEIVTTKDLMSDYEIGTQNDCLIFLNDKKAMTGVIDAITPSEDPDSSEVSITGRSRTSDIVDSEIPAPVSLSGEFSLTYLVEKILKIFGLDNIAVLNKIDKQRTFTKGDIVSSEPDKNAFELMNDYAQKLSALLITNADGDIVITRGGSSGRYSDILLNDIDDPDNNILSSDAGYDYSERFFKYVVYSQSNATTQKENVSIDNVQQKGIAYDDDVRPTRFKVIKANNACNSATCQEIATLEANIRRANSLKYSNEVAGWETNSGELYDIDKIIHVKDVDTDIDSDLLIKAVTFSFGDSNKTSLEFCDADAYTLQAQMNAIDERTSDTKSTKKHKKKKKKKGKGKASQADIAELEKLMGAK